MPEIVEVPLQGGLRPAGATPQDALLRESEAYNILMGKIPPPNRQARDQRLATVDPVATKGLLRSDDPRQVVDDPLRHVVNMILGLTPPGGAVGTIAGLGGAAKDLANGEPRLAAGKLHETLYGPNGAPVVGTAGLPSIAANADREAKFMWIHENNAELKRMLQGTIQSTYKGAIKPDVLADALDAGILHTYGLIDTYNPSVGPFEAYAKGQILAGAFNHIKKVKDERQFIGSEDIGGPSFEAQEAKTFRTEAPELARTETATHQDRRDLFEDPEALATAVGRALPDPLHRLVYEKTRSGDASSRRQLTKDLGYSSPSMAQDLYNKAIDQSKELSEDKIRFFANAHDIEERRKAALAALPSTQVRQATSLAYQHKSTRQISKELGIPSAVASELVRQGLAEVEHHAITGRSMTDDLNKLADRLDPREAAVIKEAWKGGAPKDIAFKVGLPVKVVIPIIQSAGDTVMKQLQALQDDAIRAGSQR